MGTGSMWPSQQQSFHEDSYGQHSGYQAPPPRFDPRSPNMDGGRGLHSSGLGGYGGGDRGNDRRGHTHMHGPPSNTSTPQMEAQHYGSRSAQRRGQDSFMSANNTPQLRSDMSMTGLTDGGGMPESRLKIYSDLFEEVMERDRVFGSLLRKIKTAYDMLLVRQGPAVPPFPVDTSSMAHNGHGGHEAMDQHSWAGDNRGPGSLHSNEPTTRAEGGQGWEMHRENRVLKDLVERLHLELEEAVRREHRWKQKVTKLKSKAEPDPRTTPSQEQFYGKVQQDFYTQSAPGNHSKDLYSQMASEKELYAQACNEYYAQGGKLRPEDLIAAEALKGLEQPPRFHSSHREPTLGESLRSEGGLEGTLNQGGLLSMSSISPTASVPPLPDSFAVDSARSADSGMLPQKPTRCPVQKPSHVPGLDFSKLKQLEDEEEDDDMEGEEGQDGEEGSGFEDDNMDEQDMQAHGKINRAPDSPGDYESEGEDEDACWPSFERCSIRDAGHLCHPPAKAISRPPNPVGYDDDRSDDASDDDDEREHDRLPEGLSRHSH